MISVALNTHITALGFGRHVNTVTKENMKIISVAILAASIASFKVTEATYTPSTTTEVRLQYGWTAVPHDQSKLLESISPWDPANYTVSKILIPNSILANKTLLYAKSTLPEHVFNHSMRVYYYGQLPPTHASLSTMTPSPTAPSKKLLLLTPI